MKIEAHYNLLVTEKGIEIGGAYIPKDMAVRIHTEVAAMGWCTNWDCPCNLKGYQQGQEDERNQSHED